MNSDKQIEQLETEKADLLAACDDAVGALMLLPSDCLDEVDFPLLRDELINKIFSAIARARQE